MPRKRIGINLSCHAKHGPTLESLAVGSLNIAILSSTMQKRWKLHGQVPFENFVGSLLLTPTLAPSKLGSPVYETPSKILPQAMLHG